MKQYDDNAIQNITIKYSLILSIIVFLVSFLVTMPRKPSQEILENYTTLASQIMNDGIFNQEINYSSLDVDSKDMYIKIHPEKADVYSISIETPNVIVNVSFLNGEILKVSYVYWILYVFTTAISLPISLLFFMVFLFVIGTYLLHVKRKNS